MAGRYSLDKPVHPWKHYRESYASRDSVKTILHLHKIEAKLRQEIRQEQIFTWTPEMIRAKYG